MATKVVIETAKMAVVTAKINLRLLVAVLRLVVISLKSCHQSAQRGRHKEQPFIAIEVATTVSYTTLCDR